MASLPRPPLSSVPLTRAVLSLLLVAALLAAGVAVTRLTVTDGVAEFRGPERALAAEALGVSRFAIDHPLLRGAVVARRVASVEPERPGDCADPAAAEAGAHPGHAAEVVGYTLFRLPLVRVRVTCGGSAYSVS